MSDQQTKNQQAKSSIRPVIVLPPDAMAKRDIDRLNRAGFCVVECKDPALVRCIEPPFVDYEAPERAAMALCRFMLSCSDGASWTKKDVGATLAHFLIQGTPIQPAAKAS